MVKDNWMEGEPPLRREEFHFLVNGPAFLLGPVVWTVGHSVPEEQRAPPVQLVLARLWNDQSWRPTQISA